MTPKRPARPSLWLRFSLFSLFGRVSFQFKNNDSYFFRSQRYANRLKIYGMVGRHGRTQAERYRSIPGLPHEAKVHEGCFLPLDHQRLQAHSPTSSLLCHSSRFRLRSLDLGHQGQPPEEHQGRSPSGQVPLRKILMSWDVSFRGKRWNIRYEGRKYPKLDFECELVCGTNRLS